MTAPMAPATLPLAELFLKVDPDLYVSVFLLGLGRILPILALVPFFGAKVLPIPAKIALGGAIVLLLFPLLITTLDSTPVWDLFFILCLVKELFIGAIIGMLASMPFFIVQMSGIVIDNQRGSSSLTGQDLITQSQSSMIGMLFNYMTIVIFFWLNGPFLFLDGVVKSYQIITLQQFIPESFFTNSQFWGDMISLMSEIFALATQLAAPVLLTILMSNTFLGIANRLAPQVQISFLGQGLSAFSADLTMFLAWFFLLDQMGKFSIDWISSLTSWITKL